MSQSFTTPDTTAFRALWDAQSGVCVLCQKPMLRSRFEARHATLWRKWRATFDHIIPRSKGGRDTAGNLQLTHAYCNKVKGRKV